MELVLPKLMSFTIALELISKLHTKKVVGLLQLYTTYIAGTYVVVFKKDDIWHGFLPVSLPQRIEIRKKSEKSSILLLYFLSYCVIRFAANKIKKFLISKKFNIS